MTVEDSINTTTTPLSHSIEDFGVDGLAPTDSASQRRRTLNPSAMRELIPVGGLREYWYPAIVDKKVGQRRPTKIKMLGEQIVLFRAKNGEVKASTSVCPHRGGSMGDGHCHYAGTISCPYHGWTFDETGNCVAVLGEGPESPIPGNEGARLKMYPTITLKGCVFVWMGEREPADPKEDIPPEFFQDNAQIQYTVTNIRCNWRQALENNGDAHFFYVHRNSLRVWRNAQIRKSGPTRPRPEVINGRALAFPYVAHRSKEQVDVGDDLDPARKRGVSPNYRDSYPGLGGQLYPKHEFFQMRALKLMQKWLPYRLKLQVDPSWHTGEWASNHLPTVFRALHEGNWMYTRNSVPITDNMTRMFFYYTTYGRSRTERIINKLWFAFATSWYQYYNFSGQDQVVIETSVFDQPEALSATDAIVVGLRRLHLEQARDFQEPKPKDA